MKSRDGRYTVTVERRNGRQWFRLYLGRSVVADEMFTEADLLRELARFGLTLADFEDPGK